MFLPVNLLLLVHFVQINPFVGASSVSPGKLICGSNVSLTELGSTIVFHPSKPIMGSNIRSTKPVDATSIFPSKLIFGSSIRPI